mgnify:CR=1 FL=1
MGKLDDLRDDQIEPDHASRLPASVRVPDTPVREIISRIKSLIVGDEYAYAEYTLRGILKAIETTGCVTEGQDRAVQNIMDNPNQGSTARRYKRSWQR